MTPEFDDCFLCKLVEYQDYSSATKMLLIFDSCHKAIRYELCLEVFYHENQSLKCYYSNYQNKSYFAVMQPRLKGRATNEFGCFKISDSRAIHLLSAKDLAHHCRLLHSSAFSLLKSLRKLDS